ncbi:DEAD/DEAH box helicase [Colwellia sp. Bg11-28]|uniref:DEAD/DEAH box helicase n=1 Tax=Colwellia sp. Bg11-28 TaxID=2058305 RepID=UPI000C32F14D|nr:DEAD/DEAH box helicase family protein [Colwellia sp. Bg11-28]PKH86906.1 hypothetical protein CXF79_09240 [Colwellia sp. Bg11-28]
MKYIELRKWQKVGLNKAISLYLNNQKNVVMNVVTGAGKSTVATEISYFLLENNVIDYIIYAAPQTNVCNSMRKSLEQKFNKTFDGLAFSGGICVTYANQNYTRTKAIEIAKKHRVLLILDEVHHLCGEEIEVSNSWGEMILVLSKHSNKVLSMSGTLFRSDNRPISCIEYTDNTPSVDIQYSLAEGIRDNINKIPHIVSYDISDGIGGDSKLSIETLINEKKVIYSELLWNKNIINQLLFDANEKLHDIRLSIKNASGLVVCKNVSHARMVYMLLKYVYKQKVKIVSSAHRDPERTITTFKNSEDLWLVSVDMVSEGVDIPRIQVIVYLTNKMTKILFSQIFGRSLRINTSHLNHTQNSWLYCLAHPKLLKFSDEMAQMLPRQEILFNYKLADLQLEQLPPKDTRIVRKPKLNKELLKLNEDENKIVQLMDDKINVEDIIIRASTRHLGLQSSFNYKLASSENVVNLLHYKYEIFE